MVLGTYLLSQSEDPQMYGGLYPEANLRWSTGTPSTSSGAQECRAMPENICGC